MRRAAVLASALLASLACTRDFEEPFRRTSPPTPAGDAGMDARPPPEAGTATDSGGASYVEAVLRAPGPLAYYRLGELDGAFASSIPASPPARARASSIPARAPPRGTLIRAPSSRADR